MLSFLDGVLGEALTSLQLVSLTLASGGRAARSEDCLQVSPTRLVRAPDLHIGRAVHDLVLSPG